MHGLVRCKHERRCSRARGADVSFRDVTIKIPVEDVTRDVSDVTHRKRELKFEKSQLVEFLPGKKKVDFRLLAEALQQVLHVMGEGGRWKSRHRKIVPPFSLCRKTFKLKGNKKFRTWIRSRKWFSCFGIPMFYIYELWIFYVHFTHTCIMGMLQLQESNLK